MIFELSFNRVLITAPLLLHGLKPIETKDDLEKRLGNTPTKNFHSSSDMSKMSGSGCFARMALLWGECISSNWHQGKYTIFTSCLQSSKVPHHLKTFKGFQAIMMYSHFPCCLPCMWPPPGQWRVEVMSPGGIQDTNWHMSLLTLLLFREPSQPDLLWNEFKEHICNDLAHWLCTMGIQDPSNDDVYDYGLHLLDNILHNSGCSLAEWPSMPLP